MNEVELRLIAEGVRKAIEQRGPELGIWLENFPSGCCTNASVFLGNYLKYEAGGKDTELVLGYRGKGRWMEDVRHHWIETGGFIIDITADQFPEVEAPVIVTAQSAWHERFNKGERESIRPITSYVEEFRDSYGIVKQTVDADRRK